MQTIGGRIRDLRRKKGVTITEIARETAIPKSNISSFENDRSKPSVDALVRLSDYFDVPADWILRGEPVPEKEPRDPGTAKAPPDPDCMYRKCLNLYELELIQNYRLLSEREQGKVDQFVDSLLARRTQQEERKNPPVPQK
jgi:transcriptional regulator with XRE-family HTH domain